MSSSAGLTPVADDWLIWAVSRKRAKRLFQLPCTILLSARFVVWTILSACPLLEGWYGEIRIDLIRRRWNQGDHVQRIVPEVL
uniref:Bestrophin homolog n=1 Tax=Trichuris muris TaxID=70415 RepID=A0A5S6Q0P8_TRIMR